MQRWVPVSQQISDFGVFIVVTTHADINAIDISRLLWASAFGLATNQNKKIHNLILIHSITALSC